MDFPYQSIQSMLGIDPNNATNSTPGTSPTTNQPLPPRTIASTSSVFSQQMNTTISSAQNIRETLVDTAGGTSNTITYTGGGGGVHGGIRQELKQPAKITMNIPFLMPKITPSVQVPARGNSPSCVQTQSAASSSTSNFSNISNSPIRSLINPYTGEMSPVRTITSPTSITVAGSTTTTIVQPIMTMPPVITIPPTPITTNNYNPHPSSISNSHRPQSAQSQAPMPYSIPKIGLGISKTLVGTQVRPAQPHPSPSASLVPKVISVNHPPLPLQKLPPQTLPSVPESRTTIMICNVPGCQSADGSLKLFGLPKDNRGITWCQILGIPHQGKLDDIRICQHHFDSSQFEYGSSDMRLKSTAMPSGKIFTPSLSSIPSSFSSIQMTSSMYPNLTMVAASNDMISIPAKIITSKPEMPKSLHTPAQPIPIQELSQLQPKKNIPQTSTPAKTIPSLSTISNRLPPVYNKRNNPAILTKPPPAKVSKSQLKTETIMVKGNTQIQLVKASTPTPTLVKPAQQSKITKPLPKGVDTKVSDIRHVRSAIQLSVVKPSQGPSKRPGPKCHRQSEPVAKVHLGAYARPNIPNKLKPMDITVENIGNLVMPSEDWSVNVYPSHKTGKPVYVISETLLNSDMVEIVRKSITIQPNWAMKFSLMACDVSHFNIGLGVSDISDIQAVLDRFDSLKVCSGCFDFSQCKSNTATQLKVECFVDKRYRSVQCALIVIKNNSSENICSHCQKVTLVSKYV